MFSANGHVHVSCVHIVAMEIGMLTCNADTYGGMMLCELRCPLPRLQLPLKYICNEQDEAL